MTAVRVEERLSIRVERRSLARHRQIGHGRLTTSHLKYSILWYSVLYWMS